MIPPASLHLEPMRHGDLDAVLAIERQSFAQPWRHGDFAYAIGSPSAICRVSRSAGKIRAYYVGFLAGSEFHLADLAVAPPARRQGLGEALVEGLISHVTAEGCDVVTLEVRVSNQAAVALYGKLGFHTVAIRKGYYVDPEEDALVMVRPLRGSLSSWVSDQAPKRLQSPDIP